MPKYSPRQFADDEAVTKAVLAKDKHAQMLASMPSFLPTDGSPVQVSDRHELFLRYYLHNSKTRFNGSHSYNMAYSKGLEKLEKGTPEYKKVARVCEVEASKILSRPEVNARRIQLSTQMLTDEVVDAELVKVLAQDDELGHKTSAIREYNKLKGRIVDRKDVTQRSVGIVAHLYEHADTFDYARDDAPDDTTGFNDEKDDS